MAVSISPSIEGLVLVLRSQITAYGDMSALSDELREFIAHNDVEGVTAVTGKQRALLADINDLEAKRERVTHRIAQSLGEDVQTLTVDRLASLVDEQQGRRLRDIGEELRLAIQRQRALNDVNMTLMQVTLMVSQSVINAFSGADTLNNIYTSGGNQSQPVQNIARDFFSREG